MPEPKSTLFSSAQSMHSSLGIIVMHPGIFSVRIELPAKAFSPSFAFSGISMLSIALVANAWLGMAVTGYSSLPIVTAGSTLMSVNSSQLLPASAKASASP